MSIRKLIFFISGGIILAIFGSSTMLRDVYQAASKNTEATACSAPDISLQSQNPGETYYVSELGNDNNTGKAASPFLSVQAALELAAAGDTIYICAGHYDAFTVADKAGTASRPITIAAHPAHEHSVVISTSTYESGAAARIEDSSHIQIRGLTFTKSLWGIYGTRSENIVLENNIVHDIGQEAVRFRGSSRNIKILKNRISDTGNRQGFSQYGEGIYIGAGQPDYPGEAVTAVLISGNAISQTSSEAIDIKPFAEDIIIEANTIYDIHTVRSGAVVVGINSDDESDSTDPENVIIRENTIQNVSSASQWADGNAIKVQSSSTIESNRITDYEHRGIFIEKAHADNRFVIRNNILCHSSEFGSQGDIVVEKTDAYIERSDNIARAESCTS